jgi:hypothetical protein
MVIPAAEVDMTTQGFNTGPGYQREKVTVSQSGEVEHQERIVENKSVEKRLWMYRITQLILLAFGTLEGLIGFRVLLKLIGANAANLFAHWVYTLSGLFLTPFASLLSNPASGSIVFEITSLIAMLVYALLCWVFVTLIRLLLMPTQARSVSILKKEHHSS